MPIDIADEAAQSAIECNLLEVVHTAATYVYLYEGSAADFKALVELRKGHWWDLLSVDPDAEEAIERDVHYLELRGKLQRHPDYANLVRVIGEQS